MRVWYKCAAFCRVSQRPDWWLHPESDYRPPISEELGEWIENCRSNINWSTRFRAFHHHSFSFLLPISSARLLFSRHNLIVFSNMVASESCQNSQEDILQKSLEAGSGDPEKIAPEFEPAPDGGLRAWLVATGAAFVFFSSLGFANSFGVFQEYYMSHQLRHESADKIAWIGSISTFLSFVGGAIGGPLFDRYGAWVRRRELPLHGSY